MNPIFIVSISVLFVSDECLLLGLAAPKSDQLNGKTKRENKPGDGNHHHLQVASGHFVTVNARVWTEQATPVSNHVRTGEQVHDDEKYCGNCKCRTSSGINQCNHNFIPFNMVLGIHDGDTTKRS